MPNYNDRGYGIVYVPEVGDIVKYSRCGNAVILPVTKAEPMGGYTDIWLGETIGDMPALFNINHLTGAANTSHSQGGRWELVRKASEDKPTDIVEFGETVTEEESVFGADLYTLLGDFTPAVGFFARQRIIVAAIKQLRIEQG